MRYITETKNLFDINSSPNLNNNSNITINGNSILCVALAANAHVSYRVPTVIGEKYTVSNKSVVRGGFVNTGNFCLFLSDNPNLDNSNYLTYGLQSGQSFTLTATSEFLYIHWYVCYNFDSNNPSTIEINELQVELRDTATPYVPYGYLPMRRMKYKVSNVCQLLDKSLYFETKTVDGITYTNNGDGTITINGTNTKQSVVPINTNYKLHKSHFYIKRGRFSINWGYDIQTKDDFSLYKVSNDINNGAYYYLPVGTYDNVVDKPQLLDLTEMYGAGNEPTTVEEFKQKFPNDLYPYSPYCWAKMKQMRYVQDAYGVVDLGTLSWSKYINRNNWLFYATVPNGKVNVGSGNTVNAFIDKYNYTNIALSGSQAVIKNSPFVCWDASQSQILIKDTNYTDANSFKSSVAGVKLYYELSVPGKGYLPLR